jgi:hypothetical protein
VDAMARLSQFVIDNEQDLQTTYPQNGGITPLAEHPCFDLQP